MTEKSFGWDTTAVGDGNAYSEADTAALFKALTGGAGVFRGYLNELEPTVSGTNVLVNTGAAMSKNGHPYLNDASKSIAITTPSSGTTGHRLVLREDTSAQTVRVYDIASADGTATIPAAAATDVTLAPFTITTGGAITLTDAREFAGLSPATALMLEMGGGRLKAPTGLTRAGRVLLVNWRPVAWSSDSDNGSATKTATAGGLTPYSTSVSTSPFSSLTGLELTLQAGVGTTAGIGTVRVVDGSANANAIAAPDRCPWARVRWNPTSGGNANTSTRVMGFVSAISGATNDGAYLRRNTTGNLYFVTRQGANEQATDMGAQSNAERWYDIWTPDAGVTWYCYDHTAGVLYTHSTYVPTVTTDLLLVSYFTSTSGTPTDHKISAMALSVVDE